MIDRIKVLAVCHGNICRSTMCQSVLQFLVNNRGLSDFFHIDSAATSREEIGNPVYPPARRILKAHGIDCSGKTARQMTRADYQEYDYLLAAENYNIRNMMRILGSDPDKKVHRLLDFSKSPRDIADPWYTGDFQVTWDDIVEGCEAFLKYLEKEGMI